jgi:hypothetical protein
LFIDDSPKNIQAVNNLKEKYPNVKLIAHKVEPHKEKTQSMDATKADNKKTSASASSPSRKVSTGDLDAIYRSKITNPKTGKQIMVLTALKNKNHPMHKQAMGMVAQMARQKNPNN